VGRAQGAARILRSPDITRPTAAEAWRGYKPASFALLELGEGDHVLDVGCGTGADVRGLAGLVPGVSVVGLDANDRRVVEAQAAALGLPRPIEFRVGDAHRLPFEDDRFDACRADKVLHHVADPARVLAEMTRVVRPGGRVVVSDADYETLVVTAPDRALTRRILHHFADGLPHGWIGRELRGLFRDAGIEDVAVHPFVAVVTEYDEDVLRLSEKAEAAVSPAEAAAWLASLDALDRAGRFFCALTVLTVVGRKPLGPGGETR
jgi:ubiquinone/menaquinone biosynthesis C-methylase UbiE